MTLGASDNQIQMNVFDINPVFRVKSRMPQRYQIRQEDFPVPFESGISDFLTLIGQTTYIIQGVMYPSDESSYDAGLATLRKVASLDFAQADALSDTGYVPYVWGEALNNKQLFVKVLYAQVVEDTRQGFVQPFSLICKIKDPTIYGSELKTASTAQSNPTTSTGAAVYSFTYPVVFGSSLFTVSADANNIGTVSSYPQVINVFGPVTNPRITNSASGEFIEVDVTLSSGSDQLIIQYDKDSLTVTLNGVNVQQHVTTDSTYWKIQPDDNIITLSGSSVGTGAYASVNFYDSWALA